MSRGYRGKRFVTRRHLFKDQTDWGWYIWDKLGATWVTLIMAKTRGGREFETRKDALVEAAKFNRVVRR